MKRLFLPIFVFLLLTGAAGLLGAFELEIMGGVESLTFHPEKTTAYTELGADKQFKAYPYGLINITFRQNISEVLNFSLNIERDNILHNNINAVFGAKTEYFSVKFGPFLGLIDNFDIPDTGITGNLDLIVPGAAFLSIHGSATLGYQYEFTSNNHRETAGIKLGFWLKNAIPSFSVNLKKLSRQKEEYLVVDDSLLKLLFNFEFFAKNSDVSGYVSGGYQIYTRTYKKEEFEFSDKLETLLAGLGFNWQITNTLIFNAGLEMPFFISTVKPMTVMPEFWLLSRIYAGFVYSYDN